MSRSTSFEPRDVISLNTALFREEVNGYPLSSQEAAPPRASQAMVEFTTRLARIESKLDLLLQTSANVKHQRQWYTPTEFAELVAKTRYTVSEWCRLERINAVKAESGRGRNREWRISHEELERYEREGLLSVKYPAM